MDFPPTDLMNQDGCYRKLITLLHPDGLACPTCQAADRIRVHRSHSTPAYDCRVVGCGLVFNAFTGTAAMGTPDGLEVMLLFGNLGPGLPSTEMARELGCDREQLLEPRRSMQGIAQP
jgi:hypothetical protein